MARQLFQIHLSADGCSKRGVRYRVLPPTEKDGLTLKAAQLAADGSNGALLQSVPGAINMRLIEAREALKAMLVSVTEPCEAADLPKAKWIPVGLQDLSMPGPMNFDRVNGIGLFTSKDDSVLTAAYNRHHNISAKELEEIVGKAVEVSED